VWPSLRTRRNRGSLWPSVAAAPIFNVVQILFGIVIAVTIWKALRRVVPAFDAYAGGLSGSCDRWPPARTVERRPHGLIAFLCALGFFVVVLTTH
jgi:hypothetical protein